MKAEEYVENKHGDNDWKYYPPSKETVIEWLEDYAKQEAIEFGAYIDRNWYKWGYDKYTHPYAQVHNPKTVFFTKKELYKKFKDES